MDIFQSLLDIDKALVNWIVSTAAVTDDQKQQMVQAMAAKSDLDDAINTLVAYRMKLAGSAFAKDAEDLGTIATGLAAVDTQIQRVNDVLALSNKAVGLAADLITKVGG